MSRRDDRGPNAGSSPPRLPGRANQTAVNLGPAPGGDHGDIMINYVSLIGVPMDGPCRKRGESERRRERFKDA